jgi:hypothetical protein
MIIDFREKHKEKRVAEICERINMEFDEDGDNPTWERALRSYAEEIYAERMARREGQK